MKEALNAGVVDGQRAVHTSAKGCCRESYLLAS